MMQLFQRVKDQQGITLTMAWMCIACATLLIVPVSVVQLSPISELSENYMPYIVILALVTGSFLITRVIIWLFSHFKQEYSKRSQAACRNMMIRRLDFEEKAVLREFIIQRKNVLALPMRELAVSNLLQSGVLVPAYETQEIKGSARIIKLSIAVDAREQLTHKVLGLPVGKLTEEEANQLKAARPDYARSNYIALRD
ncbi:hypothetical protein CW745_13390 [Psychromonas sp. psych-6C06]|uniref:superinfection exclusion B family protein n=1 Tax=Psychromonas sp. psych-6C06 TaxID=2058089 RepID=UPI000C32F093|nr:superinfection exclusion B family protein [Psychromonas sp. psych-6C06]PKF60863.1 hypothetical protein CW745_13390 [Psychromonas sp. psych-6C06]